MLGHEVRAFAARYGRLRVFAEEPFADLDLESQQAQALYKVLQAKRPFLDATLAVFERRADRPPKGAKPADAKVFALGFDKMKALTRRAAGAGARVVAGGHTAVPFAERGEALSREIELLVESGFTPLEAITAATGTAAAFLYRSAELGTLRKGLQADLVVLAGDPLRDITAVRSVERVMLGGRWIEVEKYRRY